MKKQLTSTLLLASMLVSLASCGSDGDTTEQTTAAVGSDTTAEAVDTSVHDDLPADLNFGGETVNIFCTNYEDFDSFNYMTREEANGDVVNDAIFNRNTRVSERLGLKLEWIEHIFDYGTRNEMYTAVRTSIMSGDGSYDIICSPTYFNTTFIAEGLLADVSELPYINLEKPYWFSGFNKTAKIGGKTLMVAGDGDLPYITGLFCLAFNAELAEENGINNIYDLVYDGKWTLDSMKTMVSSFYRDVNGNTTVDMEDRFGFLSVNGNFLYPFITSCNGGAIGLDSGKYVYTYNNEHNINIYDKVFSMLHESGNGALLCTDNRAEKRAEAPFMQNRALFSAIMLLDTVYYRNLKFSYGVIPYPKYDEEQDRYYSCASNGVPTMMVAITSAKSEKVGAVLEALCAEGYNITTPAYYEVALKTKYSNGDDMSNMFDIIRESEYMNIGDAFAAEIGGPHDKFKSTVAKSENSGVWASTSNAIKEITMEKLNALLEKVNS